MLNRKTYKALALTMAVGAAAMFAGGVQAETIKIGA